MARRVELQPRVDEVETGAVAAIRQYPENAAPITGDRRDWFSYRLGVEEDGDENKEAAAVAAAMLSLRSSVVVPTAMLLMLMLALSALEVPISEN
ncbi:hypothetical protein PVL29_024641 [Vitis rotundifolia]|uniref:Uncharacterized protein n=1 Tax=Vitis rotundifolia TaxID=103349 RepID=A0AA38YSL5_VITRO|nr:hypothetical protein PVL29_024641 [Vitis rotundifolia]